LANGIKIIGFLLAFFLPETSDNIYQIFNWEKQKITWDNLLDFNCISQVKINKAGGIYRHKNRERLLD